MYSSRPVGYQITVQVRSLALLVLILAPHAPADPKPAGAQDEQIARSAATADAHIDLLKRYPASGNLGGILDAGQAKKAMFGQDDVFRVDQFKLDYGEDLQLALGPCVLGIGHTADGAVWAVLLPLTEGQPAGAGLHSKLMKNKTEPLIRNVWLRFHPSRVGKLLPPDTVHRTSPEAGTLCRIRRVEKCKLSGSWHVGDKAALPGRNDVVVDVELTRGFRRFFTLDSSTSAVRYIDAFSNRGMPKIEPFDPATAAPSFDQLWEAFDRHYAMFAIKPGVDWGKLGERYRDAALQADSRAELTDVLAEMLAHLKDLHVWLKADGEYWDIYQRERPVNANPRAIRELIGRTRGAGPDFEYGITDDKIGYLLIRSWSSEQSVKLFAHVLHQFRDTRAMIVDVRLNGGGDEGIARSVAARFVDRPVTYGWSVYRNGPKHTDLTEKFPRDIAPGNEWRYTAPVVLLIGQRSMSSNESFVAMMSMCPQVTTMGDHTAGSSGNPMPVELPAGITVGVPRWIDYLPDGVTPIEGVGLTPDIPFTAPSEAFQGKQDPLLAEALKHVRELSRQARAGAEGASKAADAGAPRIVELTPPPGSENVPCELVAQIRFDQPMKHGRAALRWREGMFRPLLGGPLLHWKSQSTIAGFHVRLAPRASQRIVINEHARLQRKAGFQSLSGAICPTRSWAFSTAPQPVENPETASRPTLVSVDPEPMQSIARVTHLRLRFSEPMNPDRFSFADTRAPSTSSEFARLMPDYTYDASRNQFTFTVVLPRGWYGELAFDNMFSARGLPAQRIKLVYNADHRMFSDELNEAFVTTRENPAFLSQLGAMQEARKGLQTFRVDVTDERLAGRDGWFHSLDLSKATFQQMGDKFLVDAGDVLFTPFVMGFDGKVYWWLSGQDDEKTIVTAPVGEMEPDISLLDPLGLQTAGIKDRVARSNFLFNGNCTLPALDGGKPISGVCVEAWSFRERGKLLSVDRVRWYFDKQKPHLPHMLIHENSLGTITQRHFDYSLINGDMRASMFSPAVYAASAGAKQKTDEPTTKQLPTRFIRIHDGSNARMSVRWGRRGPHRTVSSGLN